MTTNRTTRIPRKVTKEDCLNEINRFFKLYAHFCKSPDQEAARGVFGSAYSLNDKLRKSGYPNFFDSNEFLTIKLIRNYAIHQSEIYNETRSLPLGSNFPIQSDLGILCLIPIPTINLILEEASPREIDATKKTCVFYKKYVDIYPCIFNFGVQLFLHTEKNNLEVNSDEYRNIKNSINFERKNNLPHFVTGRIKLPPEHDIDDFIKNGLMAMDEREALIKLLYSEDNGMHTLNFRID